MKTTNKFIVLVVGVTLLIAVLAVASLQIFRQIEIASAARNQVSEQSVRAIALLGDVVDAETGQRGFVLTGVDAFLHPYIAVRERIPGQLTALQMLVVSTAARKNLDALTPLVNRKLALMSRAIQLRRTGESPAVIAEITIGQGKELMDSIRAELGNFIKVQTAQSEVYEREVQSGMQRLFVLIITACLFTLLLTVFFAYLIYRESQQKLKDAIHLETEHLLDIQTQTNRELKDTNLNLHVSEERLAVTLNSIDDAVIATDSEGRVTLLNPLAEKLTGWSRTEAVNRPVEDIFHIIDADTRAPYPVPVRESLSKGTTLGLANHTIVIARDGTECHIADSCAPIRDHDDEVIGAVLVFRDVTERKRLDKILSDKSHELEAARAAADKANRAKSEFLSSMSHELRTPLSAILGFAQLIESGTPAPTPSQKRGVAQILKAGWYLLDLINEILDLALIESGKLSLSMESVSLAAVLDECRTMTELQAKNKNITVTFPHLIEPIYVKADLTRMKQVLINLLSNAIKYNSIRGTVTVSSVMVTPQRVRVGFRDDGPGLTAEQCTQLFQPFNRMGREATDEEGTGIGLVMTKRLIELMEGAIGVESSVGKGSEFWVELNLTPAPQPISASLQATAAVRASAQAGLDIPLWTLLYVEDNPANMLLVEDIIARRPGIRLLGARDAITGIQMAITSRPDVILMDINLPGISGVEAMAALAKNVATAQIPIVALSANAMPNDIERGLKAGFFRYLTKPIKVDEFLVTLDVAFKFAKSRQARTQAKELT